jgi:hypothetical protein
LQQLFGNVSFKVHKVRRSSVGPEKSLAETVSEPQSAPQTSTPPLDNQDVAESII